MVTWVGTHSNPALPQDTETLWALLADVMTALEEAGEDIRLEVDKQSGTSAIRRTPGHGAWARKVEWTNSTGAWRWTYRPHTD